jgi:uncharacterized membrane protein YfcA
MFWGIVLLLAGVLLLLSNAGYIPGDFWDYVIPIILIAIGGKMIFSRKPSRHG